MSNRKTVAMVIIAMLLTQLVFFEKIGKGNATIYDYLLRDDPYERNSFDVHSARL